jgi:hypothetical protein
VKTGFIFEMMQHTLYIYVYYSCSIVNLVAKRDVPVLAKVPPFADALDATRSRIYNLSVMPVGLMVLATGVVEALANVYVSLLAGVDHVAPLADHSTAQSRGPVPEA